MPAGLPRAPQYYAETLLKLAYPNLTWDCLIAYENVFNTKPDGEGVFLAMQLCAVENSSKVVLVGDGKTDVLAAYNAGCRAVLDRRSWPKILVSENYHALEKVPDGLIDYPEQLSDYLSNPDAGLPELEYQLSSSDRRIGTSCRFDVINHFYPYNERKRNCKIITLGRFLANYQALDKRRQWHELTHQILQYKDSKKFPQAWVEAIRSILWCFAEYNDFKEIVVTVIPHKTGRSARLEALLVQVETSCREKTLHRKPDFVFAPDLFVFNDQAVSSHKNHLTKEERFANVRCSLSLSGNHDVNGRFVVVLDDVVTTGATLLHAADCLETAGNIHRALVALAKTVSWPR